MARILIVLTVTALAVAASASTSRAQQPVNIDIGDLYFCSLSFQGQICPTNISPGTTVVWTQVGFAPHTVTECDPAFSICPPTGGFDSGTLFTTGATFSQTFNAAGVFEYRCNIHPQAMRGVINVVAPEPTPTPTQTTAPTLAPNPSIATSLTPTPSGTSAPAAVPPTGGSAGDAERTISVLLFIAGISALCACGALLARRRVD